MQSGRLVTQLGLPLLGFLLLACCVVGCNRCCGDGGGSYARLEEGDDGFAELVLDAGHSGALLKTTPEFGNVLQLLSRSAAPGAILPRAADHTDATVVVQKCYLSRQALEGGTSDSPTPRVRTTQPVCDYAIFTSAKAAREYVRLMGARDSKPVPLLGVRCQPVEKVKLLCMAWLPPPWALLGTAQQAASPTGRTTRSPGSPVRSSPPA